MKAVGRFLRKIRRWLASPAFEGDQVRTLQARLLNMIGLTCIAFTAAVMAGSLIGGKTPAITLIIDLFASGVILLFLHWLRQGRFALARAGMVSFGLVYIIGVTASLGTIRTPTASILLFWVLMTGLLYDLKGIVIGTIAASLAVLGLIVAENLGWLRHPYYGVGVTQWITFTALFGFSSGLTYFVILGRTKALARAEKEIEQRKQVQAQLLAAKNDLKGMIDALPDLLFEVGPDGIIHDYHSPHADLLAASPAVFIGKRFSDFLPAEAAETVRGAMREAASKGTSSGATYALDLPAGKRWFELSVALKRDVDGLNRRFICLARDITLRKKMSRGSDVVFRYGGEEFLLVFPGMNAEQARSKAEEIRHECAGLGIQYDGKSFSVMLSFGVAAFPDHGQQWEQIIDKADKALYRSKCEGRNRVTVFQS